MTRTSTQPKLFDSPTQLPLGLLYKPDFVSLAEETALLKVLKRLPLQQAKYREYRAKRRIVGFGWKYDYRSGHIIPGESLPEFFSPVVRKIAKWLDIPRAHIVEALVSEYQPGAGIGWHVDREKFEHVVGLSLGGWCTMRWRPLATVQSPDFAQNEQKRISLELEPRSLYVMQNEIRWQWQHSIPHTKTHRFSITFRTLSH